jgi:ribosome-associated protein
MSDPILDSAKAAVAAIWDKKGFEVVMLRVKEVVQYTDYVIIASATSDRHAIAVADNVEETLIRDFKDKPIGSEGRNQGRWVLLDYADFIVHVFHRPVRDYYEIERLFADAPRVPLDEPAWVQEISPEALVEQVMDYGDVVWQDLPVDDEDMRDEDAELESDDESGVRSEASRAALAAAAQSDRGPRRPA